MKSRNLLTQALAELDGRDYGALQDLKGAYDFGSFVLHIEKTPKDPFAPPLAALYRLQVKLMDTAIEADLIESRTGQIACRDYYARRFFDSSANIAGFRRGTGFSGIITIDEPGQAILERSSVVILQDCLEIRCFIGIPARQRKIDAALGIQMLRDELPQIIGDSLSREQTDPEQLRQHIYTALDAEWLRRQLRQNHLLAFIADGARLPRASGISDQPMTGDDIILFQSPESLRVEFDLPHAGRVSGMGIPQGVTLLAGGGYHGKSTLLQAIESGVYNHIPGDGRERCVALPETVKIRAYGGRHVSNTDISPFIRNLPAARDTRAFSTENASGSTSQAANLVEAMEIGAQVILMDEDSCATNFMIRDHYMQQLVHKSDEPITAYIDKVRALYQENQISTILALGGVGDYFAVADHVIQMIEYRPQDVTDRARQILRAEPSRRMVEDSGYPIKPRQRIPIAQSVDPFSEYGKIRLSALDINVLQFGRQKIDLGDLEQLIELSQTRAIAHALSYARKYMDGEATLKQVVDQVIADIDRQGLDVLGDRVSGFVSRFRPFELAFALNRLRTFRAQQVEGSSPLAELEPTSATTQSSESRDD